jgi:hypothetical protein
MGAGALIVPLNKSERMFYNPARCRVVPPRVSNESSLRIVGSGVRGISASPGRSDGTVRTGFSGNCSFGLAAIRFSQHLSQFVSLDDFRSDEEVGQVIQDFTPLREDFLYSLMSFIE